MTWLAQCPVCGLGTRVESQAEQHVVCKCNEPYTLTDESAPAARPPTEPE